MIKSYIPTIKLIALDMDGTLLMSDKSIQQETIRDIEEASARGITVSYCTGRAVPELSSYINILPVMRYGVCLAGSLIYDFQEKRVINKRKLNANCVRMLIDSSHRYDAMLQLLTVDQSIVRSDQVRHMSDYNLGEYQEMFEKITTKVPDIADEIRKHDSILKANIHYHTTADRQSAYEELKHLPVSFVFSEISTLEIMPDKVTKASGLSLLAKCLGIPMNHVMAIGDGNNDRDMLKAAGFSVAMGNAWDDLKAFCDAVTDDNDHNGAGKAIRKYTYRDHD